MMKIGTDIEHAAMRIKEGKLVAIPTETVYGLAANALSEQAIKKIYEAKGRPSHNPLITHVANAQMAKELAIWNDDAETLSEAFWPGPLTMVLKRSDHCTLPAMVSAGLDTVALRIPAHQVAQKLLNVCGLPLAAPSANRSGHITSTSPEHVANDFTDKDIYVLEAGDTNIGLESTVIDLSGGTPTLLRPGHITHAQLEHVLKKPVARKGSDDNQPASPGMLSSHYAPNAKLRLNATYLEAGEALLAFGAPLEAPSGAIYQLSESEDLSEASSRLFSGLRELDSQGVSAIAAMPIPTEGIGEAINDRLKRAAAPKN